MRKFKTRGKVVEVPEHVDELSPVQYEYYMFLATSLLLEYITGDYLRVRLLSYLIGLGSIDYTMLTPEHIAEIESQADVLDGFFRTAQDGRRLLVINTPINLLKEYKGYHGPGDWLRGMSYGEWVECMTVLESIGEQDDIIEAYEHIARKMYKIPAEAKVPDLLMVHATTLLISVWSQIQGDPIVINGQMIDFRIIFKSVGPSKPDDKTGWTGITFEVAKEGLFGNVKEVEATDMWDVLLYLYKCKFEYINEIKNNK